METIESIDHYLFFAVNSWHSPFFDFVFYWISNAYVWIPLYVFIFVLFIKTYGIKKAIILLLIIGIGIAAADLTSVYAFKLPFARFRPTHNHDFGKIVHTVYGYRGGLYSFVSSHAANFALWTSLVFLFLRKTHKSVKWIFCCTILVGYSRIYLGVHYPSDVVCGYLVGVFYAIIIYFFIGRKIILV